MQPARQGLSETSFCDAGTSFYILTWYAEKVIRRTSTRMREFKVLMNAKDDSPSHKIIAAPRYSRDPVFLNPGNASSAASPAPSGLHHYVIWQTSICSGRTTRYLGSMCFLFKQENEKPGGNLVGQEKTGVDCSEGAEALAGQIEETIRESKRDAVIKKSTFLSNC